MLLLVITLLPLAALGGDYQKDYEEIATDTNAERRGCQGQDSRSQSQIPVVTPSISVHCAMRCWPTAPCRSTYLDLTMRDWLSAQKARMKEPLKRRRDVPAMAVLINATEFSVTVTASQ